MLSLIIIPLCIIFVLLNVYSFRFSVDKIWPSRVSPLSSSSVSTNGVSSADKTPKRTSDVFVLPVTYKYNMFLGKITVGRAKPGEKDQVFTVDFNTETEKFWVPSVEVCENADCAGQPFSAYTKSKSETHGTTPKQFELAYPWMNKVNGIVSIEDYKLASGEKKIIIKQQEFIEVTKWNQQITGTDGIFGLSLVTHANHNEAPVWNMEKQFKIEPVFGFLINPRQTETSKLVFGGTGEDLIEGKFNVHNVIPNGDSVEYYDGWNIQIDKIELVWAGGNREEHVLTTNTATPAPGVLTVSMPSEDYESLNKKIFSVANFKPNAAYFFDCNEPLDGLPDVVISLKGITYVMSPKDYVTSYFDSCRTGFTRESDTIKLGQTFLRKFYTRFNIGKRQVEMGEVKKKADEGDSFIRPIGV